MTTTDTPHPAKFSTEVLVVLDEVLDKYLPLGRTILDPFAGVGGIHKLGAEDRYRTYAVEIEPEWAEQAERLGPTWCGDFFLFHPKFVAGWPRRFHAMVTSPTYANRMADKHDAKETCRECGGTGHVMQVMSKRCAIAHECGKCGGTGHRDHKRITYKHKLDRDLSENNSGGMQWGGEYKMFHAYAWKRVIRHMLEDDGLFVVNVKNHIRGKQEMPVVEWHRDRLIRLGLYLAEDIFVPTPGMRFGENHEARVEGEHVLVFRAAPF